MENINQIILNSTISFLKPSLIQLGNKFAVIWQAKNQANNGYNIWGQLIDINGNKIGNQFDITNDTLSIQNENPVATDLGYNSKFIVLWNRQDAETSTSGICGQLFDYYSEAKKIDSRFYFQQPLVNEQLSNPQIIELNVGGVFVVSWNQLNKTTNKKQINIQTLDGHGNKTSNILSYAVNDNINFNYVNSFTNFQTCPGKPLGIIGSFLDMPDLSNVNTYRIGTFSSDIYGQTSINPTFAGWLPHGGYNPLNFKLIGPVGENVAVVLWSGINTNNSADRPLCALKYSGTGSILTNVTKLYETNEIATELSSVQLLGRHGIIFKKNSDKTMHFLTMDVNLNKLSGPVILYNTSIDDYSVNAKLISYDEFLLVSSRYNNIDNYHSLYFTKINATAALLNNPPSPTTQVIEPVSIPIAPPNTLPVSPEITSTSEIKLNQAIGYAPNAALLKDNRFVVVWAERNVTDFQGIGVTFGRIYAMDGTAISGQFKIDNLGRKVSLAALGNGGFLASWRDTSVNQMAVRVFDNNGSPLSNSYIVNPSTVMSDDITAVGLPFLTNSYVNAVLFYPANGITSAQVFDADGKRLGFRTYPIIGGISNTALQAGARPTTTFHPNGEIKAAWFSVRSIAIRTYDAYQGAIVVNSNNAERYEFRFPNTTNYLYNSALGLAGKGYVIAWNDQDLKLKGKFFSTPLVETGITSSKTFNISNLSYYDTLPAIASLNDASFVVAWNRFYNGTYSANIGQLFDPDGNRLGEEFVLSTSVIYSDEKLKLASSPTSNRFVATWTQGNNAYFRLFTHTQAALDQLPEIITPQILNEGTTRTDLNAIIYQLLNFPQQLAVAPNNNYIISYVKDVSSQKYPGISVFDEKGVQLTNRFIDTISVSNIGGAFHPLINVAILKDERFIVVWPSALDGGKVVGQLLTDKGELEGSPFALGDDNQWRSPLLISLANNNFAYLWIENISSSLNIVGKIFTPTGATINDKFQVNTSILREDKINGVPLTNGKFVIVWLNADLADYSKKNLYGQVFFTNGTRYLQEFDITITDYGSTYSRLIAIVPQLTALACGNFAVSWYDGNGRISTQIMNDVGEKLKFFQYSIATVSAPTNSRNYLPAIVKLKDDSLLMAFSSTYFIYGSGSPGEGLVGWGADVGLGHSFFGHYGQIISPGKNNNNVTQSPAFRLYEKLDNNLYPQHILMRLDNGNIAWIGGNLINGESGLSYANLKTQVFDGNSFPYLTGDRYYSYCEENTPKPESGNPNGQTNSPSSKVSGANRAQLSWLSPAYWLSELQNIWQQGGAQVGVWLNRTIQPLSELAITFAQTNTLALGSKSVISAQSTSLLKDAVSSSISVMCQSTSLSTTESLSCVSEHYHMHVLAKPAQGSLVGYSGAMSPDVSSFGLLSDHYDVTTCKPITYFAHPSVVCEGKQTSIVYTPVLASRPFEGLDGQLTLWGMGAAYALRWWQGTDTSLKQVNAINVEEKVKAQVRVDASIFQQTLKIMDYYIAGIESFLKTWQQQAPKADKGWAEFALEDLQADVKNLHKQGYSDSQALAELKADVQYLYQQVKQEVKQIQAKAFSQKPNKPSHYGFFRQNIAENSIATLTNLDTKQELTPTLLASPQRLRHLGK